MGIDDYLIGATIRGVISQRLLRRKCNDCVTATGSNCRTCNGTGYKGRTVTYEIGSIGREASAKISSGCLEGELEDHLVARGMARMKDHSNLLITNGATTREEVARVIQLEG